MESKNNVSLQSVIMKDDYKSEVFLTPAELNDRMMNNSSDEVIKQRFAAYTKAISAGEISPVVIGKFVYIRKSDVDKIIAKYR